MFFPVKVFGDSDESKKVYDQNKVNGSDVACANGNETNSDEMKTESFRKVKSGEIPCMPSNIDLDEWGQTSIPNIATRTGSSSVQYNHVYDQNKVNGSDVACANGNISFRLSRTASLRFSGKLAGQSHNIFYPGCGYRWSCYKRKAHALQRLGSRYENLSGHDRSCILLGQHRSGHCTCRTSNHGTNSNDDTNARASISRIVMLAEALFEVLDEIHQQSVVLSSHPSVSSIGSVPAPNEVVDSLPVKLYTKLHKHQEDAGQ
ncbi:hypothetical protein RIF29_33326 [Crotalaria pallida]|uniref:Uncharacterized protein n=1 Tax=Crotalaria pallida TaxID=3830 RepID=A0AAN9E7P4_CROPI